MPQNEIPVNQVPQTPPTPPQTSIPSDPAPVVASPAYLWDTQENVRHSIRVICDEEGLSVLLKDQLSATLHCESNWNPKCVHPNTLNGKVVSTDYGLCQINDYYHIGPGKDFPSVEYVMNNPEACVRWMCRLALAGKLTLWVCYLKGMYEHYSA